MGHTYTYSRAFELATSHGLGFKEEGMAALATG